jgi:hypothetical protein
MFLARCPEKPSGLEMATSAAQTSPPTEAMR